MTDPMLEALRAADEAARQACHAYYATLGMTLDPVGPNVLYDQIGTLYGLLCKVEQIAGHLRDNARRLSHDPASLRSADDTDPGLHAAAADSFLDEAADAARDAARRVNAAWSEISPVGMSIVAAS